LTGVVAAAPSAAGIDTASIVPPYLTQSISYDYTVTQTAVVTVTQAYVPAPVSTAAGGSYSYYVDDGTTIWLGATPVASQSDVYTTQSVTVYPVDPNQSTGSTHTITSTIQSTIQSTIHRVSLRGLFFLPIPHVSKFMEHLN
jgi:hypothetical protein